jgi:CubicO group peptidase (beta-lactamase class C family)
MWMSLLVLVHLAGSAVAVELGSVRVERVEAGLRPAIVMDKSSEEQFHLVDRMHFYKTPGVSIAVIDRGSIAWARGYGVREAGTKDPIKTDTIFQAASISKPVAAVVALRLVEQGMLELDEDVNRKLSSWKLPENEFTAEKKVSLRMLLSHRAGLSDFAGFREAAPNQALPTLREILETSKWTPAPIRVGFAPGSRFAYSGGGYCLIEQLLEDVSGKPFPRLAHDLVLKPLHMASSSFDQNLPPERRSLAAVGHQMNGKKLPQGWNLYPATSAAGLWTTPSDLARFAIELQTLKAGGQSSILGSAIVSDMLSVQGSHNDRDSKTIAVKEAIAEQPPPSWGLGVGLIGNPPTRFFHTGSNPGYQCELHASLHGRQGAVIMTNGQQGWRLAREILWSIAQEYEWPDHEYRPEIKKVVNLSHNDLERFVGLYRIWLGKPSQWTLRITRDGDRMFVQMSSNAHRLRLYASSRDACFTVEDAMTLNFVGDAEDFAEVVSDLGWRAKREPDLGMLP